MMIGVAPATDYSIELIMAVAAVAIIGLVIIHGHWLHGRTVKSIKSLLDK